MGHPVEEDPVKPDDSESACYFLSDLTDNNFPTDSSCQDYCTNGMPPNCVPLVYADRGAGVEPRYSIYAFQFAARFTWIPGKCQCLAHYVFSYNSDSAVGEPGINCYS